MHSDLLRYYHTHLTTSTATSSRTALASSRTALAPGPPGNDEGKPHLGQVQQHREIQPGWVPNEINAWARIRFRSDTLFL